MKFNLLVPRLISHQTCRMLVSCSHFCWFLQPLKLSDQTHTLCSCTSIIITKRDHHSNTFQLPNFSSAERRTSYYLTPSHSAIPTKPITMAIDKRRNTRTLVPSRNVRAKMIIDRIKSKPYTPILRKRKRYSSDNTVPPLSLLQSNENVENGPSSEEEHEEEEGPLKVTISPCKSPRIRFKSTVQVAHIPSRFHYPELMKQSLWGTLKEIHENARRNTIEFAAEGWDWRAATEDDEMYVTKSGDRIHPAHVRKVYTITPTKCEEEGQGDHQEGGEVMVEDRIETHC